MKTLTLITFLMASISFNTLPQASVLTKEERLLIDEKLINIPTNRDTIFSLLFPKNNQSHFITTFQDELESILKSSLLIADTEVSLLTYKIRRELDLERNVAAFHKQGKMDFKIVSSHAGEYKDIKQNDSIRTLTHASYFKHGHNVFIADEEVSADYNTFSLLFHELSHAAFDQWISAQPEKLKQYLKTVLPAKTVEALYYKEKDGKYAIDGDLYDLLSERYAFELEYRLNVALATKFPNWPLYFSYTEKVPVANYPALIDDYVRRNYNIDHPALKNFPIKPLDMLLFK